MSRVVPLKWLILLLGLTGLAQSQAEWLSRQDNVMGTRLKVEIWQEDPQQGASAIEDVLAEFHRIDHLMSPYRDESELSQLNREASKRPVVVSEELFALLEQARQISELTQGAFDITFASVGHLYDYRKAVQPSSSDLKAGLPKINYRFIELNPDDHSVRFSQPGVRIDLGGIAKGYGVDRGILLLQQLGIEHALISAGGDSRIIGERNGRPWNIGIRAPRKAQSMVAVLPLTDVAVSTSGDYERYFEADGVRHHHIISPQTGRSASQVQSVTIVGPNTTQTDALSTSVFVLGTEAGLELVNRLGDIEAVIIDKLGRMHYSDGLQDIKQ